MHSYKKMLTHQGEFLVTWLHRQILIEGLRTTKHVLTLPLLIQSMQALHGLSLSIHKAKGKKSSLSLTKLTPVCFKNISECTYPQLFSFWGKGTNIPSCSIIFNLRTDQTTRQISFNKVRISYPYI